MFAGSTACTELTVVYPNFQLGVKDISLTFPAGSSTALVGPSGSGKSTVLNAICGLAPVESGSVVVTGIEAPRSDPEAWARLRRERIGTVFQQGLLLEDLSVIDNVAIPLRLIGSTRRHAVGRARDVLTELGIEALGARMPWALSGGERQRVAVARAIAHEPKLILADEPTGALDRTNSELVMELLLRAVGLTGATLVVVTHDDKVADSCETRVRLEDGRLASAAR